MKPITIEITRVRLVFEPERTLVPKTEKMEKSIERTKELTAKMQKPVKAQPKTGKRSRHIFTEQEKKEAAERYAAGEDVEQIAKSYGSTAASVLKLMQRIGVRRHAGSRRKAHPQPDAEDNEPAQ